MDLRRVVCILCAGAFCTGLVLAGDPTTASMAGQPQLAGAQSAVPAGVHVRPIAAGRICVNYIYDNAPGAVYYWPGANLLPFETCVRPLDGQNFVSCFAIELGTPNQACDITAELVPHEGGIAYPGTTQTVTVDAGWWNVQFDLAEPVDIGADIATYGYIMVRQTYSVTDAGALMGEEAELGVSPNNWFYWQGGYWWFGGDPFAAFSANLFGPEDTPFTGACCDQGVCFETNDYYTCEYVYGLRFWFPFESCPDFANCPHLGACCVGGVCTGTMYEIDCTSQNGTWFIDEDCNAGYVCPPPPANDNCGDVAPFTLVPGTPVTETGDNSYATQDCSLLWPEVWHAFTIGQTLDVKVDFCGSPTYFGTIGIAMVPDCPCTTWIGANDWSWDCTDGNAHIDFLALVAGTYFYPVYSAGAQGPYQVTFTATGGALRGDVNCDGIVNPFDIDPFVQCLVSGTPTAPCTDCSMADINGDGIINPFDIDPFVQCIIDGGCP